MEFFFSVSPLWTPAIRVIVSNAPLFILNACTEAVSESGVLDEPSGQSAQDNGEVVVEETVQVVQLGVVEEGEQSECAGEGVVQGGEDGGGGEEGLSHTEHNGEDTDVMTASPIFLISCPRWEMMPVCNHCQR